MRGAAAVPRPKDPRDGRRRRGAATGGARTREGGTPRAEGPREPVPALAAKSAAAVVAAATTCAAIYGAREKPTCRGSELPINLFLMRAARHHDHEVSRHTRRASIPRRDPGPKAPSRDRDSGASLPFDHLVRFARVPARFRRRSARRAASNIGVGSESWTFRGQMPRGARDRDPAGHDAFRAAIARRARFDSPVDARPALRGPSRDPRRASRAFTRIDGWTARPPRGVTRTSRNEYAATSRSARF